MCDGDIPIEPRASNLHIPTFMAFSAEFFYYVQYLTSKIRAVATETLPCSARKLRYAYIKACTYI